MSDTRRAIIIGLDGATFDLLNPLMETGVMPHLKAFRDRAAYGCLLSTTPPTTPPAWTTCTTGLNPGRHGIFDFLTSPLKNPDRPPVSSRDVRGERLWAAVERFGGRSVVVNVPITYPPEPISGCMVSGMMTPGWDSPFTRPPDLKDRLKAVCGNYIINIDIPKYDTATDADALRFLDDVRESLERRREAVRYLMDSEKWTFFMVVFIALDRIMHLFAKFMLPGSPLYDSPRAKRLRPRILDEFRRLDDVVGEIAQRERAGDTVFILSDHGFGVTDGFFNANTWLIRQGLLSVRTAPYYRKRLFHILESIGDHSAVRTLIPASVQSSIRGTLRSRRSSLHSPRTDLASVVDWEHTSVFFGSIPAQGFYINERTEDNPAGTVSPDKVDALKDRLKAGLLELKHPATGHPLTDAVWFREELYEGPETRFAPHVLFRMSDYAVLGRQHLGAGNVYTTAAGRPVGFHRSEGVLMVSGDAVEPGEIRARMEDIMPTVLHSMRLPVSLDLDGCVLKDVFRSGFSGFSANAHVTSGGPDQILASAGHPPILPNTDLIDQKAGSNSNALATETPTDSLLSKEDRKAVEDRLRNLGYLE